MKTITLLTCVLLSSCAAKDPETEPAEADVTLMDVSSDAHVADDAVPFDLASDTPCPRGEYEEDEVCVSSSGCSAFQLTREDLGCLFLPDTQGRFTPAECASNADCEDSPYGRNCILRVCQPNSPCVESSDCAAEEECVGRAACIPARSTCTTDDDCADPGFCLIEEQMCI